MDPKYLELYERVVRIANKAIKRPETNIHLGAAFKVLNDEAHEYATDFVISVAEYEKQGLSDNARYNSLLDEISYVSVYKAFKQFINRKHKMQTRRNNIIIDSAKIQPQQDTAAMWSTLSKVMDELNADKQVLILWRLGLVSESEACQRIGISRPQLFNRWRTAKAELFAEVKGMLR